jgi:Flp pilus assembly pilin Flp
MITIFKKLVQDDKGQDLAEYGIALAVIGIGAALAAIAIAGNVSTLWSKANSIIAASV